MMRHRLAAGWGVLRSLIVYHGQPWRVLALRRFMRELVEPGTLAFDIGAHAGNRTLALSKAGARVVALEPQPAFAGLLGWIARGREITIRHEAVGAVAGTVELAISRRHPTLSSTAKGWPDRIGAESGFETVSWDTEITVPVTTLDQLIAEHGRPDFTKIDVEGSEADILQGLSEPLPLLAFEYLPGAMDIAGQCLDRLQHLGDYEFNLVVGEMQRFHRRDWMPAETFRPMLETESRSGQSGDVYARLRSASPRAKSNVKSPGSAPAVETSP